MARVPRRSSRAARQRALDRLRRGTVHSPDSGDHPLRSTWTGVQLVRGRWAAQIRLPGARTRLWTVGCFEQALEAALAHDTALFCFYGARRLPSPRRFNFPTAPRPKIAEETRATLTLAEIKRIAGSHARNVANFYVGPLPAAVSPATASPPPSPPAAAAADGAAAVADEASATTDGSNGNNNCMG